LIDVQATRERRPGARRGKQGSRKNLVETVGGELRKTILRGDLKTGDKLPSEAGLTRQFKVSRTVIREAIASLRADGLVEARQGAGVFILNNQPTAAFPFEAFDEARISSMIEMLELRTAIEIEAASLAALRRSPAQEEAIFERCRDIDRLIAAGKPTPEADFAFHLAIADATNNPRFRESLQMMGHRVIPRTLLQSGDAEATSRSYLGQIQAEHRAIAEAISARDEQAARDAVRTHLKGSQQRYRQLLHRN
jgi:GntR family transcriptional repressor for pyruvate dehydrogenase complex